MLVSTILFFIIVILITIILLRLRSKKPVLKITGGGNEIKKESSSPIVALFELLCELPQDKSTCLIIGELPEIVKELFPWVKFTVFDQNITDTIADTFTGNVDGLYVAVKDVSKPLPANIEYSAHKDTLWEINMIRRVKPKVAAIMKFHPPKSGIKSHGVYVPTPEEYKIPEGTVIRDDYSNLDAIEGWILTKKEVRELVNYDYGQFPSKYEFNLPNDKDGKKITYPEQSQLIHVIAKYLHLFDIDNYNVEKITDLLNKIKR